MTALKSVAACDDRRNQSAGDGREDNVAIVILDIVIASPRRREVVRAVVDFLVSPVELAEPLALRPRLVTQLEALLILGRSLRSAGVPSPADIIAVVLRRIEFAAGSAVSPVGVSVPLRTGAANIQQAWSCQC